MTGDERDKAIRMALSGDSFRAAGEDVREALNRHIAGIMGDRFVFEGRTMNTKDLRDYLVQMRDLPAPDPGRGINEIVNEERQFRAVQGPREALLRVEIDRYRDLLKERDRTLAFRVACDAAYVEGQLARSIGLDVGVNPYHGFGPAERICPDRMLQDFHIPWLIGWRAADEQAAVDDLIVAAQAATRDGKVTPACPAGEGLRAAVAAYLARRA